jgi:hypothetical protein
LPALSANLLVNGDAEAAVGSTDGSAVTTPGWTVFGEATAVKYGATNYPTATDPGPPDRGNNFFAGGPNDGLSILSQTVDVSTYATSIDAGGVQVALSGYFGGWKTQDDIAVMTATFQDGSATAIGQPVTIGGVSASDRGNVTELLLRATTQPVPAGTRSIAIDVTMTRSSVLANDGYADDLSLMLLGM